MRIDAIFGAIGRFVVRFRWLVILVWIAGAIAVLCDQCAKTFNGSPVNVVLGSPDENRRTALANLSPEPFDHDAAKHAAIAARRGRRPRCARRMRRGCSARPPSEQAL